MLCGIVDVGSNTIQLSVYRLEKGNFQTLFNQWETVGLMGYVHSGVLSPAGMLAACRTLTRFHDLLEGFGIRDMRIFATASLRNISNTEEALAVVLRETGLPLEILSGEEEALFSFRGATWGSSAATGLLTDIGGGSTELVAYGDGAVTDHRSLPVGALSLYSQYTQGLFPTAAEHGAIRARIEAELGAENAVKSKHLLGVGGTVRAVVGLCNSLAEAPADRTTISALEVKGLLGVLGGGDRDALRLILRIAPDRVHTLVPGLIVLDAIIGHWGVDTLTASTGGVREGYLLSRVG